MGRLPARGTPRSLHPIAWWLWALGLAVAASRTTNPLLLGLIVAVCACVVAWRRSDSPWALAFRYYLLAGAVVVALRVLVRVVFGTGSGSVVLVDLPEIPLPDWTSGLTLLGPLSADALLGGLYDGMRLATMLVCVGAANALANPKRLLKSMPPALHEAAAAVVVALSVFPQLAESVVRVRRARELRGVDRRRRTVLRSLVVPVLEDALDRSLLLAASIDARGYGRSGDRSRRAHRWGAALMLLGLCGVAVGVYALLDQTAPVALQLPALGLGVAAGLVGFALAGRSVRRTVYEPDRWRLPELVTVAAGVTAAAVLVAASRSDPVAVYPRVSPPQWPELPYLPTLAILLALLPGLLTPSPAPHPRAEQLRVPT